MSDSEMNILAVIDVAGRVNSKSQNEFGAISKVHLHALNGGIMMYGEFKMKGSNFLIKAVLGITIILGVVIFISVLINGTKKESEVLIKETTIEINGQFGTTVNKADITDIQLVDTIPAVGNKLNGAGLGEIKKGDFNVEGLGTCKLYIHSNNGPFILITLNNQYIIINFKDTNKTESVYEDLKTAVQE